MSCSFFSHGKASKTIVALLVAGVLCGSTALAQQRARKVVGGPQTRGGSGGKPDLIVRDFERTAAPRYNGNNLEIPVQFYVNNRGDAATSIQVVNAISVDGTNRWTGFMDVVGADSYKTVTAVVKIADPNKLLAGRTLRLQAYADAPIAAADTSIPAYGRAQEENENNNKATLDVSVPGGLDLKLKK